MVRAEGTALLVPPPVTIVIFCTFAPKSEMGPVTAVSVAQFVSLIPV